MKWCEPTLKPYEGQEIILRAKKDEGTFEEFKAAVVEKYGHEYGDYAKAIRMIEILKEVE